MTWKAIKSAPRTGQIITIGGWSSMLPAVFANAAWKSEQWIDVATGKALTFNTTHYSDSPVNLMSGVFYQLCLILL